LRRMTPHFSEDHSKTRAENLEFAIYITTFLYPIASPRDPGHGWMADTGYHSEQNADHSLGEVGVAVRRRIARRLDRMVLNRRVKYFRGNAVGTRQRSR
jgi:hypothetical protein